MADPEVFFICLYLKDGVPIGHVSSPTGDCSDEFVPKDKRPKVKRSGMEDTFTQFIEAMMGYLEYVPLILYFAPRVSAQMVQTALKDFMEKNCITSERSESKILYKFSRDKFASVRRFEENLGAAQITSRSLPRLLTVGLVSALEYHLNLVMKEIAYRFPDAIFGKDKTVGVGEIMKFATMDELKEAMINEEIDRIQRENIETQISWILKKSNLDDFTSSYTEWPRIIELVERRNLFVHTNGVVNAQYLKARDKYNFPDAKEVVVGTELHAEPEYFTASVALVLEFGAMLMQIVWRKIAADQTKIADRAIGDLGFELISRGQHRLAARILEFAKQLRNVSDEAFKRRTVVNLANAYKLAGDDHKSIQTLDSMDWTAVDPAFKICVAAVRGDVEGVVGLMKKIGTDSETVSAQDFREWPVFYHVRSETAFTETYKEIFGEEYVASSKKQAGIAQVMEWLKEKAKTESAPDGEGLGLPAANPIKNVGSDAKDGPQVGSGEAG